VHYRILENTTTILQYSTGFFSEGCKATDFKFGRYIHRVHPNKRPLKFLGKRERGRIQGLPKVLEYPLLSQEWIKLYELHLSVCSTSRLRYLCVLLYTVLVFYDVFLPKQNK